MNTQSQLVYSSDDGETWSPISQVTEQLPRITQSNGKLYARKNINGNPKLFTLSKDYKLSEISDMPIFRNVGAIMTDIHRKILPDGGFAVTDSAIFIDDRNRLLRWNKGIQ